MEAATLHSEQRTEPGRKLLLIRHGAPLILQDAPARAWLLSDEGRRTCEQFAGRLAAYHVTAMLSSAEPKARETAAILAARLGLAPGEDADLNEHKRDNVPWLDRPVLRRRSSGSSSSRMRWSSGRRRRRRRIGASLGPCNARWRRIQAEMWRW